MKEFCEGCGMGDRGLYPSITIRKKILLLLIVVLLPVSVGIVLSGLEQRRQAINEATNEALVLMHSLAAQQEHIAIGTRQMLSTLAQLPGLQNLDADYCSNLFHELSVRYPYYANITVVLPDGELIASSGPFPSGINFSDRKYLQDAIRTRDFSIGEYAVGKLTNLEVLTYAYPVLDGGKDLVAFVVAGFKLDEFAGFLRNVQLPEGFVVGIMDRAGVLLCRLPENTGPAPGTRISREAFAMMDGPNDYGTFQRVGEDGVERIYAFKKLRIRGTESPYLFLSVGMPKDTIMRQANLSMVKNLSILGLAAVLAASFAWAVGYFSLIRPITRLTIAARKFGTGALHTRTQLPHSSDELGALAASFDEMAALLELRDAGWKRAEEALKDSRQHLANIIDFLPDPTFVIDKQGKLISWNRAMEDITGIKAADVLGKGDYEHALPFYGERRPMLADLVYAPHDNTGTSYARVEKKGSVLLLGETFIPLLGDGGRFLFATASSLHDSRGESVGAIESIRDITDMVLAQKEKEHLESQLRQAQKMEAIGTLAGGIAHDFNNILSAIIGYTELALIRISPVDRNYLQQVLQASLRAKDLVQKILSFSRVKKNEELVPIEIAPIIYESHKLLRASLPATIEIRLDIGAHRTVILGDGTEIHQLLINLCTNAAQAMDEEGGILEVGLHEVTVDSKSFGFPPHLTHGQYLRLTVSDSGQGISPEILDRIFEPYFTTKQVGKGSGLGLAMVHGIVERHKGTIFVYSTPGQGTTFSIYLPMHEHNAAVQSGPAEAIPGGTERILFVDDEPMLADLGRQMLGQLGYDVTSETNSQKALDMFRADPARFDLVITDYTMPGMTGAVLAREMMGLRPDIPVILCSGFTENMSEEKAQRSGIGAFVMKPLNWRGIAEKVRQVLEERKAGGSPAG